MNHTITQKQRLHKPKMTETELIQLFWGAPNEAFFSQDVIAPVAGCKVKTMEGDRWRGRGIPYRKCGGRVLYRKADVVEWLESHKLVSSTSEYQAGGSNHVA